MTILLVVIVIDVLRAGPEATGYLNVALGAGGAIGALLSGVLVLRPRLAPALLLSGAAASAATFLLGIAPILPRSRSLPSPSPRRARWCSTSR